MSSFALHQGYTHNVIWSFVSSQVVCEVGRCCSLILISLEAERRRLFFCRPWQCRWLCVHRHLVRWSHTCICTNKRKNCALRAVAQAMENPNHIHWATHQCLDTLNGAYLTGKMESCPPIAIDKVDIIWLHGKRKMRKEKQSWPLKSFCPLTQAWIMATTHETALVMTA